MKQAIKYLLKRLGLRIRISRLRENQNPGRLASGSNQLDKPKRIELQDGTHATFFGYHDKSPFSADNRRVLACSVSGDDKLLETECSAMKVGYFEQSADGSFNTVFNEVAETAAWSWQQGCMLQWNPAAPDREIVFNRLNGERFGAVYYDIEKRSVVRELDHPAYALGPNGRFAASLNFTRLARLRPGYGYRKLEDPTLEMKAPKDDGLILIDLKNGSGELVVSLEELAADTLREGDHYVNHATFSPDGEHIAFFHIYPDHRGGRIHRFYLYNIFGKELRLLEANRFVSHYCWLDDKNILTSEDGPGGYRACLYDLERRQKSFVEIPQIGDFHPMAHPVNPGWVVADTKPDWKRRQHLFLFNIHSGKYVHLGSFLLPKGFDGPVRCDLHPRWDRKGHFIASDTANGGRRKIALLEIPKSLNL